MSWASKKHYLIPLIILTPIILYCLIFTKEGRNASLHRRKCNDVIRRVWGFSIVEKIQYIIPDMYYQLTSIEKVNFLVIRIMKNLLGFDLPVEVCSTGIKDIKLMKKSNDPMLVVMIHNYPTVFLEVILRELNDKKCFLIAANPELITQLLRRSELTANGQIEIIKNDKSCLVTLAKKLSRGCVALCAVDSASSESSSYDLINPGIFVFAEKMGLSVYFTKLIATKDGEFTVEFKYSGAYQDARRKALDYVSFLLPERKFHLKNREFFV